MAISKRIFCSDIPLKVKQKLALRQALNQTSDFGEAINMAEDNSDMYFIAQAGDRCDNLAQRFYGNPSLWWFIARANNLKTMNVPAGTSLRIPISTENAKGF